MKLHLARGFAYDAGAFAATGLRAFVVSSSGRSKSYTAALYDIRQKRRRAPRGRKAQPVKAG